LSPNETEGVMRKLNKWAVVAVLGAAAGLLAFAAPALSEKPAAKDKQKAATIPGRISSQTKVAEEDVLKVIDALGPAVREHLAKGEVVELPGLGAFRVVRIPEHRDLIGGRPVTVPGVNSVEFVPTGQFVDASNAAGAIPQETVPPFEFRPLPDQTKSLHVPDERMPNVRTR
jgi:nucleoid DNA-binding protein